MYCQNEKDRILLDSISKLITFSETENLDPIKRFNVLLDAKRLAKASNNDSVLLKVEKNISYYYIDVDDMDNYIKSNHKIKRLATQLNDSKSLAFNYYALGYAYFFKEKDSAYYYYTKAVKSFEELNLSLDMSAALGGLAKIQLDGKDYFGASESAVKALRLLDGVEETNEIQEQKWILFSTLASISDELDNIEEALEYHQQAYEVALRMEDDFNNGIYTLNNIGSAKRKQSKYSESVDIFKDLVENYDLKVDDPSFYALVLENLAYSKYLCNLDSHQNIKKLFDESYKIADSLNDEFVKMGTCISMAKFFKGAGEEAEALKYANETYQLSKKITANDILLEVLMLLSELEDSESSVKYLNEHVKLSDSLLKVERNVRNKFARIELKTDQLEAENEQISRENLYLIILSGGILLTAILIYILLSQRAKNRKLKLMQVQQEANEQIYNLMLGQQDKVEEARTLEKKRISEELHDGVLGRLFGTRLSLDSINFKDGKEAMMSRANYIGQLKVIEEDIRKISHELNTDFVSGAGFMDIVTELIDNQSQAYGLKNEFNHTDDISWDIVPNKTKINIYRVIQESLQNIYKHANAKAVKISISLENDVICLSIIDDGNGFDTTKSKKGIGLKNMTSRVTSINGEITFSSQPNQGTAINVKIPYTSNTHETY
ncbi:MAG: hypothetical protein Wins2KO_07830 [Winogradskyella sp.]